MAKDGFDIHMSEYERYGLDWDAQKLHEFIRTNMTDVYAELQRAKVEITLMDANIEEIERELSECHIDVEALEKEVLEHENTIRELEEYK